MGVGASETSLTIKGSWGTACVYTYMHVHVQNDKTTQVLTRNIDFIGPAGCVNNMMRTNSHCGQTGILSCIRQSERQEVESAGFGPNLCLSAIVFSPLVGCRGVEVFSSRDTTGESIALSCSWSNSTITDLDSNHWYCECRKE